MTSLSAETISYSRGANIFDVTPAQHAATSFADFAMCVLADRSAQKGLTYVCGPMRADENRISHRRKADALTCSWIAFDFDGFRDSDAWRSTREFLDARFQGFWYYTASSTPEAPRARAVIAVDKALDRASRIHVCMAIESEIKRAFGDDVAKFDASVYRPEQPVFTPIEGAESGWLMGAPVIVDEYLRAAPPVQANARTTTHERAQLIQSSDPVVAALSNQGAILRDLGGGKLAIVCPFDAEHSERSNDSSTAYLLPHFNGCAYGKVHCLHAHCVDREQQEYLRALGLDPRQVWRAHAGSHDALPAAGNSPSCDADAARSEFRFRLLDAAVLDAMAPIRWRVRDVFPATGLAAIYGPSMSGKSFLGFDIACAIARGHDWFGHRVDAAPVVYVCLEGEAGYKLRVDAWKKKMQGEELPAGLRFVMQSFRITDAADVIELSTAILAEFTPGCVVIIDTLNRAAPASDENSSKDMGMIIEAAKRLQERIEGLVVLVSHTGKDAAKGLRGHSSLLAALDAAIEVKREGESRTWEVAKVKDGKDGAVHAFRLEVVELGVDDDGEPLTSCVVESIGAAPVRVHTKPYTPAERCAQRSYEIAARVSGHLDSKGNYAGLHLEDWRPVFYSLSTADNDATKRQNFGRARNALLNRGELEVHNNVYRLAGAAAIFEGEFARVLASVTRERDRDARVTSHAFDADLA